MSDTNELACAKCGRPTHGCYSEGCYAEGCPVAKPTFSSAPTAPAAGPQQADDWCVNCHVHGHQASNCEERVEAGPQQVGGSALTDLECPPDPEWVDQSLADDAFDRWWRKKAWGQKEAAINAWRACWRYWLQYTATKTNPAPAVERGVAEALRDALSVCSTVTMRRDRKIVRDGCVLYAQTEEWCRWAECEVAPKLRAALTATVAAQGDGAQQVGRMSEEQERALIVGFCQRFPSYWERLTHNVGQYEVLELNLPTVELIRVIQSHLAAAWGVKLDGEGG